MYGVVASRRVLFTIHIVPVAQVLLKIGIFRNFKYARHKIISRKVIFSIPVKYPSTID